MQNLENFVSMAIQGTQVPMYTKHTLFFYFSDFFQFLFFIFYFYMKNKINNTEKTNNKNMLSKATKLDANA